MLMPTGGSARLRLDDLLAPLTSQTSSLLSLKKSAKALTSIRSGGTTLSAPLPQRTQERLDREAAYEQTKEEVAKWKDPMKRIKEVRFDILGRIVRSVRSDVDCTFLRLSIWHSLYKHNLREERLTWSWQLSSRYSTDGITSFHFQN
jgi:Utp14 protein